MDIRTAKLQVLAYSKKAYKEKLMAGTSGNLSVCIPEKHCFVITPSSVDYNEMQEEDLVLLDFSGHVLEGHYPPSSEWRLHAGIYRNIPRVAAVVHTHSPYATACAAAHYTIPPVLIEMIPYVGGSVEVAPYATPGTEEIVRTVLPILNTKNACLLANHGVVAVGEDLQAAYINSVYTEDAAKIVLLALAAGLQPQSIPEFSEHEEDRNNEK